MAWVSQTYRGHGDGEQKGRNEGRQGECYDGAVHCGLT